MTHSTSTSPTMTIGLDVGDRKTHFCVLDSARTVIARGSFPTAAAALRKALAPFAGARVILEAGSQSPWMSRELQAVGYAVQVADARRVQVIATDPRKSDRRDAEILARLGASMPELLGDVHHRSAQAQGHLCIVRARDLLVRMRRMAVQQIRGFCKAFGVRLPSASTHAFSKKVADQIPKELRLAVDPLLHQITELSKLIDEYEDKLAEIAKQQYPETRRLRQIDSVGPLISLSFILALEDPHRFPKSRRVGAWLGLCSRSHASGDSTPQLRISKAGDKFMRRLLVQGAQRMLGPFGKDSDLRRYGLKLIARGGKGAKKRAAVAVARKLAVLMHRLWISNTDYEPLRSTNRAQTISA